MVMKKSNHIHASGILTLSTDRSLSNKKSVYCCSSDETFGIWNCGDSGELEVDIQNTANKCQGVLAVYGEDVYLAECSQDVITGVDRQIVVKYGLSAFLPSHPLLTFSLEITALACNGKYLIAGSNDFLVKCLKLQDEWDIDESPVIDRYEYDGIILSISISPDGDFFSVSTADGYVQLRPTLKTSQSAKKSLAKFKVCDQFSHIRTESPRIECVWQPNGKYLYLPSKGCIIAVESANWEKKKTITNPEIANETFSVLTIAPEHGNEFFLAASTIQGSIVVWKQNGTGTQFQIINIHKRVQQGIGIITSIAFNPQNDNVLILAYSEGYLCSMTDAKQIDAQFQLSGENGNEFAENSSQNNPMIDGEAAIDTLNDDDNDLDDLETDLGLIKSRFGFNNREDGGGGFNHQNSNNNYPPVLPNYALQTPAEPCATIKGMSRPKTFSIGSTPFSDEGHYLVWNSFGVIKNYKSEGECTIEINFHDSTIHHEIIMDNSATNYTIGDINADFIALASKRNSNKESELYVHHVTSWDHESRKWNQQMEQGEVIECLCLGQQFIAIYTTLRYLRIFTPSGTQRFVISLPGSLVTMCAHGSKIATAYSNGSVLVDSEDDYEHQILLSQYEVNPLAGECSPMLEWEAPLALSPYSKLIWIQFSSAGNLVSMDDDCIVRIYLRQKCTWIPVLVGAKHLKDPEADFLWPISFAELPRGQFRYIYCRNSKYPPINKTLPPITTIPIEIPTINPTNERSKLEAELMANELQQIIARDVYLQPTQAKEMAQLTQNYVANLLKLFSISCQSNRESRAAEIAHRATNSKIVQGLCNYAAKVQRPNLSEKVAAIGRERIAQIELEENEQMQRKRMEQIKTKPLGMINSQSGMEKGTENDSPIIAPPKILMTKRKITNLDSMLPPKSKAINKNPPTTTTNPFAKPTEKPLVEKENGNDDLFVEMGMEGVEDDVSTIGGENELDSSFCSSIFPTSTSMIMDSSSANNPFKKAKKTPTPTTSHKNHRVFAEKDEDNSTIVDFFDDLTTSMNNRKDKN